MRWITTSPTFTVQHAYQGLKLMNSFAKVFLAHNWTHVVRSIPTTQRIHCTKRMMKWLLILNAKIGLQTLNWPRILRFGTGIACWFWSTCYDGNHFTHIWFGHPFSTSIVKGRGYIQKWILGHGSRILRYYPSKKDMIYPSDKGSRCTSNWVTLSTRPICVRCYPFKQLFRWW